MTNHLVLVGGHEGTGKSEFARDLARITHIALIDWDTVTGPLAHALAEQRCTDPSDTRSDPSLRHIRPLRYQCLMGTATEILDSGSSVIAAAPFLDEVTNPEWLATTELRCHEANADLHIVWVRSDLASVHKRLAWRNADRDAWKLANWDEYVKRVNEQQVPVGPFALVNNAAGAAKTLAEQALELAGVLLGEDYT